MTDDAVRSSDESRVRAIRFPTTVRALSALGAAHPLLMPLSFWVGVDRDQVVFEGLRMKSVFFSLPVSSVRSVSVGESRSAPPYPQVALAIVMTVMTGGADRDLPIVPVSDDGKASLTWKDAEVRLLAKRLQDAIDRQAKPSGS